MPAGTPRDESKRQLTNLLIAGTQPHDLRALEAHREAEATHEAKVACEAVRPAKGGAGGNAHA